MLLAWDTTKVHAEAAPSSVLAWTRQEVRYCLPQEDLNLCMVVGCRDVTGALVGQQESADSLTWVFVFLEAVLSVSSASEATFSRCRLVFFRGDAASSFTFCNEGREGLSL